ncbi:MAG: hypothetical protein K8H90_05270 [Thermoanaerobaculia bacterium]|nr:hypothetical protein [Thermoanaerobaculia bacterium]
MADALSPTELRSRIYRVLDEIAESGEPREIVAGERRFLILPLGPAGKRGLWQRPRRSALSGITADELVATHFDYEPDPPA